MRVLSVEEAAKFLNIDVQTVYRLRKKKEIKSLSEYNSDVEFSEYELQRYLLSQSFKEEDKPLRVLDNQFQDVFSILNSYLKSKDAKKVIIDVAFLKKSGWELIRNSLLNILENGGEVEVVVGLDFAISDPGPIREMIEWKSMGSKIDIFCYKNGSKNFHPKFYYIENYHGGRTTICGSSNLTNGGFKENVELNIISQDPVDKSLIDQQLYFFHAGLLRSDDLFVPTVDTINDYEQTTKEVSVLSVDRNKILNQLEVPLDKTIDQIKLIHKKAGGTSQEGLIVNALSSLKPNANGWIHLDQIYSYVRKINIRDGLGWKDASLETSIRGRLNNHFISQEDESDFKGKAIFIRKKRGEGFYKLNYKNQPSVDNENPKH